MALCVQAKQTVIQTDATYEAIAFQLKFMSAVVASSFGRCYPFIIIVWTELSVIVLLFLAWRYDYSNIHSVRFD